MGYLSNFIVYMFAMTGVIMIALLIFKHTTSFNKKNSVKGNGLRVIDTLSLSTRKTLYIIEAGNEKFLIAGDIDRTALIAKLDNNENKFGTGSVYKDENYKHETGIYTTNQTPYGSVIRNLAEKIKG